MEITTEENLQDSTLTSNDVGHQTEDVEPQLSNQGSRDAETTGEITEEELGGILEVIAATGKFWHDWDTLRGLLSFRLKQVLAEYPEAGMDQDQQSSSLGEPYVELVRRLDEALFSFTEGPPFTLQRLCEILLTARSIYPNLSKLALALEKNLLVTSTLTISTDPYPSTTTEKSDEPDKGSVEALAHSSPLQNGLEPVVRDEDEEMADAEEIAVENKSEIPDAEKIATDNKIEMEDAEETAVENKIEMEDAEETAVENKSEMKDVEETAVDSKKETADMEEIDIDSKKETADMEEIDIDGKKEMADADIKGGDKESTEESTNGTAEVSSTLSTSSDPSGEPSLPSEHITSTS